MRTNLLAVFLSTLGLLGAVGTRQTRARPAAHQEASLTTTRFTGLGRWGRATEVVSGCTLLVISI